MGKRERRRVKRARESEMSKEDFNGPISFCAEEETKNKICLVFC